MPEDKLTPFGDAVAGSLGALFANTVVFPLDVIKTRLQVQNRALGKLNPDQHYTNALDAFLKILRSEGISGLYAGIGAGLFGTVAQNFAYFYWWSWIRNWYFARRPGPTSTAVELSLGAAAGAMSQIFTLPIAVVATRQQTGVKGEHKDSLSIIRQIIKEEGYQGLWKGLRASLVLCSNPAITYGTFERLKAAWLGRKSGPGPNGKLGAGEIFVIGAIAKTLATVVTYPYILAKVRLQWKPPAHAHTSLSDKDRERVSYKSSLDVLKKVLESDGIVGWYKGMPAQITKAVLCQAILFVSKEEVTQYTLLLFRLLAARQANALKA
ncbi:mitochondrial carrier domain-containing protein [Cladochytrium replicatum]|nr:mitochondrial carrier domain-containing protein [Cladochytrium replicatum]